MHNSSSQALDDWTNFYFIIIIICIFTCLETLTIRSCNYFSHKTFSSNPQSTLVCGLLYRQGWKRGVLVLWSHGTSRISNSDFTLYRYFNASCLLIKAWSHPLPSSKIRITARELNFIALPGIPNVLV